MKVLQRLVLILLASLALTACGENDEPARAAESPAVAVDVATVARHSLSQQFEAGGTIEAHMTALVAARIAADVQAVLVSPGDRVRRGQVLVRLDQRDREAARARASAAARASIHGRDAAQADRRSALAAVQLAQVTHDRILRLIQTRAATAQELDQAVSALEAARARVAAAEARVAEAESAHDMAVAGEQAARVDLSFTAITAPFDGVVTEKLVDVGNAVAPGMPLMRVEDGRHRVVVAVDTSRAPSLALGQRVEVTLGPSSSDSAPTIVGTIAELARHAGVHTQSLTVRIDLPPDDAVRSGQFARVKFITGTREALTVPVAALQRSGQLVNVFVVDDQNRAHITPISIGAIADAMAEVLSGLQENERVVVNPPPRLTDGVLVRVADQGERR